VPENIEAPRIVYDVDIGSEEPVGMTRPQAMRLVEEKLVYLEAVIYQFKPYEGADIDRIKEVLDLA
jgi:hypothetical protein